jgi:hypothetical protein
MLWARLPLLSAWPSIEIDSHELPEAARYLLRSPRVFENGLDIGGIGAEKTLLPSGTTRTSRSGCGLLQGDFVPG